MYNIIFTDKFHFTIYKTNDDKSVKVMNLLFCGDFIFFHV